MPPSGNIANLLSGDNPVLMGIVNVTPDSFSDGGLYLNVDNAVAHGLKLYEEGAAILDIGGESTRPGSRPISPEEEQERVLPVIEGLKGCGAILSIDTRHPQTMRTAAIAGVSLINDITALSGAPESLEVAARAGAYVCLMHMKGDPQTMQDQPQYDDVFEEVYAYLAGRIEACEEAGIPRARVIVDPGIGFGKTLEHNIILLNNIDNFKKLGVPVLLGASRKRFIQALVPSAVAGKRLPGSLAAVLAGIAKESGYSGCMMWLKQRKR